MSNRVEVDIPSDIEDDDGVRRPLLKGAQTSHVSINDDTPRRSANHNADATWRQISRQQSNESLRSLAFTPDVYLTEDRIPEITLSWHHINVWTVARSGSKSGTCGKQILRNGEICFFLSAGISLGMRPAIERRRYIVTTSLIC